MAVFNVKDFGAVGNGIEDDFPAFQRALDALDSLIPPGEGRLIGSGGVLFIPAGLYNLTQTLFVKGGTIIQGCGSQASALRFIGQSLSPNTTIAGIVIEHAFGGIRDLSIATDKSYNPTVGNALEPPEVKEDETNFPDGISHSGIILRAQSSVENCFVDGFEHDGIHIFNVDGGLYGWHVRNCLLQQNGRHGLFVSGGSNGGCAMRVECAVNRKYGFYEHANGNTYVACLAQTNGVFGQFGGGYHMANGRHTLLGCVEESDQFDTVLFPSIVIGGTVGQASRDGVVGRQYPLEIRPANWFPAVLLSKGDFSAPGVRSSGVEPWIHSGTIVSGVTTMILADSSSLPPNKSRLEIILPDTTIPNSGDNLRGYQLTVKKVNVSSVPVVVLPSPQTGQKIDNQAEVVLTDPFSWVTVLWGLDTWHIIGRG